MTLLKRKNDINEIPDRLGNPTKKTLKLKSEQVLEIAKAQNRKVLFLKQGQNGEYLKKLKKL